MPVSTDRPNVLLITTDQQRFDTLGCNGSRIARTPHLDRLAERSVVFDNAFIQNTVCIPSRACIQTGRYTHQHGARYMESEIDLSPGLPEWEVTFMERLQQAGYRTGATGKIHMMPERGFDWMEIGGGKGARWTQSTGLPIGPAPLGKQYAAWLEARSPGAYERIYEQRRKPEYKQNWSSVVNCLPLEQYVETYILEKTVEFMTQPSDRPFFMWCGFCGPHGPHDPPASHADLYPLEDLPMPPTLEHDMSDRPPHLRGSRGRELATRDNGMALRRYMSFYLCLVTLIDEYVGKLVETLEERGLMDNTLILYTTDHGEMMGDFGRMGKGAFYEPVIHAPLIATPPGGAQNPGHFEGLIETMDIAPTILDYAGVDRPEQMQATSFRPVLEGGEGGHDAVLCKYTVNNQAFSGKCLRTARFKYALWTEEDGGEFYDLQEDPGELRNLWNDPAYRDERDRHAELLLKHLMNTERPYVAHRTEHY